jgi:hypothetical protein
MTLCVCVPPVLSGQALSAAYPAAVQSLPPAAEALRLKLGGLGGAGEAGLQQLAKTAAGVRACVCVESAGRCCSGSVTDNVLSNACDT